LYKLRLTWTDIFPRGKLYAIDIKANEIDPNWPLITPPSSTASRTTTTAGAKIPSSSSTATTTTTTSTSSSVVASTSSSAGSTTPPNAHIHVNPKFMPPPKVSLYTCTG
jgi:cytoskeletal protein RodZ